MERQDAEKGGLNDDHFDWSVIGLRMIGCRNQPEAADSHGYALGIFISQRGKVGCDFGVHTAFDGPT